MATATKSAKSSAKSSKKGGTPNSKKAAKKPEAPKRQDQRIAVKDRKTSTEYRLMQKDGTYLPTIYKTEHAVLVAQSIQITQKNNPVSAVTVEVSATTIHRGPELS